MNLFVISALILTGLAVIMIVRPLLRKSGDMPASPVAAVVLGLVFPAAVLMIYLSVSNHDWSVPPSAVEDTRNTAPSGDIADMVAALEKRLQSEPGDLEGWLMLGRTYARLQRMDDSIRAYRRALALEPVSEAKLGIAEARIVLDRNSLTGEAGQLVEEVLAEEPDNPKALFYGGMVAMVRQDVDAFRQRWQKLLTLSPPEEIRTVIESQLAMVEGGLPEEGESNERDLEINVDVTVASGLAERVDPGAVLYLLARDPNRPGPPLAVVRQAASILPATLTISDVNAMMPGFTLASLSRVQLVARISKSGDPVAQAGDLFGEVDWLADNHSNEAIPIVIDRLVE